jgi:RNA ligase
MKIKGDEYVRLHRILTNFSTTDIWELLRTKGNMDEFLERVPDEFDKWVKETVRDLVVRYENIEKDYAEVFSNLKNQNLDRKDFATKALHYRHSSLLFSMLDGKSYQDMIWKIIKPKWKSNYNYTSKSQRNGEAANSRCSCESNTLLYLKDGEQYYNETYGDE